MYVKMDEIFFLFFILLNEIACLNA